MERRRDTLGWTMREKSDATDTPNEVRVLLLGCLSPGGACILLPRCIWRGRGCVPLCLLGGHRGVACDDNWRSGQGRLSRWRQGAGELKRNEVVNLVGSHHALCGDADRIRILLGCDGTPQMDLSFGNDYFQRS